ncbi:MULTISPECIES: dihydroneopterin aldolase [Reichenbachiella]|uniref:7,8-dihydroneopterin aldolase n=1 Tax=Reichenbachiella agariperforans TaxID=156994 RepID=A0A1M6M383_REIAG|nr:MULTISPECIES: dihydroneopterin aldolase [Reichenbachiella]MBU2914532.1 dihydroneopterin aldolase [Reichenbachiella agariperforans]RJE73949.1 dihydroneopterin aldolase [Reichenbachiella sp. MSK19-1]SHJ77860.1 dihydroneopterin aldolase [Reichenbachiella agariperforans]
MLVKLEGLDFFSHHGFYAQEREIGNKYTVDVEVELADPKSFEDGDLDATVNYEIIYSLVEGIMKVPTKLLETLSMSINHQILEKFPLILSVKSTVSKHNPPIKGVCHKASVTLRLENL